MFARQVRSGICAGDAATYCFFGLDRGVGGGVLEVKTWGKRKFMYGDSQGLQPGQNSLGSRVWATGPSASTVPTLNESQNIIHHSIVQVDVTVPFAATAATIHPPPTHPAPSFSTFQTSILLYYSIYHNQTSHVHTPNVQPSPLLHLLQALTTYHLQPPLNPTPLQNPAPITSKTSSVPTRKHNINLSFHKVWSTTPIFSGI
jgi:hypothetical protein